MNLDIVIADAIRELKIHWWNNLASLFGHVIQVFVRAVDQESIEVKVFFKNIVNWIG